MPVSLLILSACVSGLATRLPGDELIGPARAAAVAGAARTVTTLWEIHDNSPQHFFRAFYEVILTDGAADAAVRAGIAAVRAIPEFDAPVHWAPYVLIGDPG